MAKKEARTQSENATLARENGDKTASDDTSLDKENII
jgi:hypothetical protein